jgi:autotransporter-associated beta strand protein
MTIGAAGATVDTGGFDVTLAGSLGGTGGLSKIGAGTLTLAAANSYTGGTTVSGGTLVLTNAYSLPSGTRLTIGSSGGTVFHAGLSAAANSTSVGNAIRPTATGTGVSTPEGASSLNDADVSLPIAAVTVAPAIPSISQSQARDAVLQTTSPASSTLDPLWVLALQQSDQDSSGSDLASSEAVDAVLAEYDALPAC